MSESTSISLKERIALAAARTHRNPSLAQKEAGNYPKGHFPWNGHTIAIETPKGAIRTGVSKSGTRWAVQMPGHYGYIKRTVSDADGDAVDVIVGPHPESDLVCVVDQKTPGGKFDEHKVVIGTQNVQEARELYLACYSSGWTGMRSITPMTRQQFSVWLRNGDTGRPIDRQVSLYARDDQPRDELGRFSHADHVLKTAGEIESGWHSGALVSARELRKHSGLSKPDFDRAVYELATSRKITPHKHDFATSLSPGELDELVDTAHGDPERSKIHANDGRYWVGIAKGKGDMKYSRVELAVARYALSQKPDDTNTKWITIHPHGHEEGTGTPVKIDGKGNIVGGPKGIADKGIKKLSDFGNGKGTKNTGNGHELAQEDQRRTDAAKERLKDVDVDFKEAKYTVKGNEVVDADGKRHGAFRTPEKAQAAADEWNKNGKPGEKKEKNPQDMTVDELLEHTDGFDQPLEVMRARGRLNSLKIMVDGQKEEMAKGKSFRQIYPPDGNRYDTMEGAEAAMGRYKDELAKTLNENSGDKPKPSPAASTPANPVSERTELAAAKARQVGLFSQRELGGAPQLFDTGKEFVKEKKGSPSPVKEAAPSKLEQIDDELKAKAEESKPLAGQKSLLDQAKDAFADAVDRPATPIEKNGIQMTQATAPGVSHDDIPYESAYRAHARTSFVPEKRARQRQNDYVNQLNSDWEYISSNLAPGQEQAAKEEFERYRDGYKRHYLNALHAASRTMSPMITGPARFPVNSNSKKIDTEMRRYDDLRDFRKKALSAIRKKIAPAGEGGPIKSSDSNAVDALKAKLEGLQKYHEAAKGINKIVRSHVASSDRHAGVTFKPGKSRESAIKEMMALGVSEDTASKALLPDYMGRVGIPGYSLTNNNANMKRIQDRIAEVSKMKSGPAKDNEYSGGVRVSEDPEAARIRMHFPGKPSREVIDHLKSNGFRWSPSEGAWQRHLNSAGRYAVESTLKKFGHEPVAGEASSVPGAEGENEPPELMPMAAEEPEKDNEKYSRAELAAARVDYARETRPIPAPQSRDAHKPAPTPPTSTSGGGKKKSGGGWITLGGGSHVHIGDDGKILHGCPGLKGERVQSLKNESDESRHVREVRQAHAEARGLTGHDVTAGQAKQLASPNKVKQHEVAKQAAKGSGHSTANVLRAMSDAHEMSSADRQMFRPALDRLMKVTGATPAKARDWENVSYKDHSSWPDFDHWARVIAADHPELGMNKDDHDTPAKLWDLLREEGQRTAQDELHSPEIARAAVEMLGKPVRGRKSGRSDQSDTSFDPDSFGDTSFDPDKFSRVQLAQARYQKFATT